MVFSHFQVGLYTHSSYNGWQYRMQLHVKYMANRHNLTIIQVNMVQTRDLNKSTTWAYKLTKKT